MDLKSPPDLAEIDSDDQLQIIVLLWESSSSRIRANPPKYLFRTDDISPSSACCGLSTNPCHPIGSNPPDPHWLLFLVIPHLEKKTNWLRWIIFTSKPSFPYPPCSRSGQLALVLGEKMVGDICIYKYNEDKLTDWIRRKCVRLEQALEKFFRSHHK